jgi:hypothetical protein
MARGILMVWECQHARATRMIGANTTLIGESGASFYKCRAHYISFVDQDMLMRFHPGLGVGHVYSHRCPMQPEPEPEPEHSAAQTAFTHNFEDLREIDEAEDQEDSEDDNDDDDEGTEDGSDAEQWFGSSNKSLLDQFDKMYDSEISLDYEN